MTTAAPTPISSAPSTPASNSVDSSVSAATTESSSSDIDSDPTESFSAFKERISKQKPSDLKQEKPKVTSLFDLDKTDESKNAADTEVDTENTVDQVLKVGDKEYRASDLEKLHKDFETVSEKSRETELRIKEMNDNVQTLLQKLKTDPNVFSALQIPKEIIERYYHKTYIEPTIELTQEQKAFEYDRLKKERQESEKTQVETAKKTEEDRKAQELQQHYQQKWVSEIQGIIKAGNLPESEFVLQRVGGYIKQAIDKGLYHLSAQDIAKVVNEDIANLQSQLLKTMTPEQLKAAIGEEGYKKLREEEVKQFQQGNKFKGNQQVQRTEPKQEAPKRRYSSPYDLLD